MNTLTLIILAALILGSLILAGDIYWLERAYEELQRD